MVVRAISSGLDVKPKPANKHMSPQQQAIWSTDATV